MPTNPAAVSTFEVRVSASSDDAEERPSGSVYLDSSDLELVYDRDNQIVGIRFNSVLVPPNATITNAYVQFQTDEDHSDTTSLLIQGQAIDNAPTFASSRDNISSRVRTAASVAWNPVPWTVSGEAGPNQRTPNITAIVQEIVNRPGWAQENSLAIIITGTGRRNADAYDGEPSGAPLLHVEYTTGSVTPTPTNTPGGPTPTNTPIPPTPTNTPVGSSASIVISSDKNGSVPGLNFRDEDIMAYNSNTGLWSMIFDGSDVGLGNVDVDGFAFLPNGHLLLSVDKDFTLNGFGAVDDSDILEFIPSSYGSTTSGGYVIYFDGSNVGLDNSSEDVDAIDFDASGNLLISVKGSFDAQGLTGKDEDLFVLSGFTPGANTSGTWGFYFDGSDVSLRSSDEDIFGLWADHANSKLYLTTRDKFSMSGFSGDEDDIFVCHYTSLGSTTACIFTLFWNGESVGFDEDAIDGLSIGNPPTVVVTADIGGRIAVDDTVEVAGDDANEPDLLDGEETTDEEAQNNFSFLPLINN